MVSHQSRVKGQNHFSGSSGHTSFDEPQAEIAEFNEICMPEGYLIKMIANSGLCFTVYLANRLIFQQDLIASIADAVTQNCFPPSIGWSESMHGSSRLQNCSL